MTSSAPRWTSYLLAAGLAALPAVVSAQAAPAPQASAPLVREQVERRLQSTTFLVEQSSAAKQVDTSGNAEAKARREKARELLAESRAALAAGDLTKANRAVETAARTMTEAVRMSAPEQVTAGKMRADFDARMSSTRALIDAQKRIVAEKGAGAGNAELLQRIEAMVADAQKLADAGKLAEGGKLLDQAYGASRAAIGGMRGGDTLVRSLNFATKEEEYAYEVDRNETHKMLVEVLLKDRRGGSNEAMVEKSVKAAADLRRKAEEQAARKDFEGGVRTLEESTRELVRAIRGAGVFIPG